MPHKVLAKIVGRDNVLALQRRVDHPRHAHILESFRQGGKIDAGSGKSDNTQKSKAVADEQTQDKEKESLCQHLPEDPPRFHAQGLQEPELPDSFKHRHERGVYDAESHGDKDDQEP